MGLHDICKNPGHRFLKPGTEAKLDSYIYNGICNTCGLYKIIDVSEEMKNLQVSR